MAKSKLKTQVEVEGKKYVVTANFLGTLTRGDIRTADAFPSPVGELVGELSIREATAEEAASGATWIDEPHQAHVDAQVVAEAAPKPKRGAAGGKRDGSGRFVKKSSSAPAPVVEKAADDTKTEG
jgi:hypothetical protein